MASFIIVAAMKGRFASERGNLYDNFQMLGYMEAGSAADAVTSFFDQAPFPIRWEDVEYLWAERLADHPANAHYGDYDRVYIESLRQRWDRPAGDQR
jgi:hypothetical protein